MASTEKWVAGAGQGLTWGNAFTASTLNSIASVNAILSDVSITNGTALDMFADLSIALGSAAFAAPGLVGVYIYPLNSDGSTYGDGRFGSAASGTPPGCYFVGNIGLVVATQAQTGTLRQILLPPGTFKFLLYNNAGVTWVGSGGNTCQYRTYNRTIV